ncbi:PREDICTED: uncharacterized protein LOC107356917 [Acropora digitifera]|uniref:uncharacterized protein LOC107356917 n=1 Tax=Acropora digitifera TaxID=70779 RepID=UPI00077ADB7A|nr:PREDICTED: uncharacterized protein LOC107356917 [Acropora digitifera]
MNLITHRSRSYKRQVWNFNNVNSADLNCELSQMDWFSLCENTNDIDETYSCWYSHFRSIIEKYIPLKMVTIRPNDKPWMDSEVRHAIRRRDRLLRIHNIRPSPVTWESYRAQRNFVTSLIRFAKKSFYERANTDLSNPDTNCKKWWSIVNKVCGRENSSTIPPIIENEVPIFDSKEKACIFNDYFVLQTELPLANAIPPIIQPYQTQQFLSNIIATEEQVLELMKGVDISKACGYDGIGNKIIKLCSEGFHVYFTYFINLSLSLGQYPSAWKLANVIPLFKNDNPQHKVNYRPVSLLASFSKICERVVFFHLYNFLMETGFLYKFQSGFRPGDSTINQLIFLVHKIYEALEDGKEVRVVFLDISKAFDKEWHAGLLRKLEALGVQSPLLQWFESYLCNRKQRVVIEGQCSDWRTITSGVPQGSVLGPLLFLIYINDITDDLFRTFNCDENMLSLRDLLSRSEYFQHSETASETERLSDQLWSHVLRNPKRVLIFFDGFDESSYRSRIASESFICNSVERPMLLSALYYNLMEGNLLPEATILTTTRPHAMDELRSLTFDKTIEILGFASEQIKNTWRALRKTPRKIFRT